MISKQRFYAMMDYNNIDRMPTRYIGTPEINKELMEYFEVKDLEALRIKLGDDFRSIVPKYIGPELKRFEDGSWEGLWGERYCNYSFEGGSYAESIYQPYKDIEDKALLDKSYMPTADWYDYSDIKEQCMKYKDYVICVGHPGIPDFINGIARYRGVEQVLLDIACEDEVYIELMNQRFDFYYEMYQRIFEKAEGLIDIFCLGEDLGTQNGLLISPNSFNRLFKEKLKAFIDLGHQYGAKVMMHSCGSCRGLIDTLIEIGLDILDVVQVDAAQMDIQDLYNQYYKKIAFCGSISVQSTLPFKTEEEVVAEVKLRKELFNKGGMIIGPTHHIQAKTPIKNIIAMYKEVGSLV